MARATGEHGAYDKKNPGTLTEADEDEIEKGERTTSALGPPGFYD